MCGKPSFAYKGGGGVKKSENHAYVVYGWSLTRFSSLYRIDQLYLDTTYCKPEYDFPSQHSVIKATVDLVKQHLVKYPRILICVGSYTIGKERIFTAIANEIKAQIWGSTEKVRVLKTLSDPIIESNLTRTSCNAQIHVVEMHKVHSVHFRKFPLC